MKNYIYNLSLLFLLLTTSLSGYAQIVLNPAQNVATCNLGAYGNATISVPSEALTGDNIALNITLPGTFPATCTKTVQVSRTSNLLFQSSGAIPFSVVPGNPLALMNSTALAGNDGQNFNLFFKFPNYTTCNGAIGTFNITITTNCAGVEQSYQATVSVKGRADNYWSVTKEFVAGNLTCGVSSWIIRLHHNNPNGSGLGAYNIHGTITENPAVPIISGGIFNINNSPPDNSSYVYAVSLQNCSVQGSVITNTANYNFTLGDGTCGVMNGTVTASAPPLASPNASISFTKAIVNSYNTNLTPGCQARYQIAICNNGNVPWTNLQLTDNLNISGITITGPHQLPGGWSFTNTAGVYTFTNPGAVLNPGDCLYFYLDFQINASAVIGSTVSNTAQLSYQGAGANTGGGSTINSCAGINCPVIDMAVQNKSATANFVVEAARAIPYLKKCILDPPSAIVPPIYQIGDLIKFSLMVGNSGSGSLSTTVSDAMGMPGQNLQIIPGSISYKYYQNESLGYQNSCNPYFGAPQTTIPFTVTANTSNLQNPTWAISGMPGICQYYRANFLIIEFQAKVLPQLHGTKTNTATLPYNSNTLSSAVNYSIDQVGVLAIQKRADTENVENGQSFNYLIKVSNNGSVPLNHLVITDPLPSCATLTGHISIKDGAGNNIAYTMSGNVQINVNPTVQLQPGDAFNIVILVTKSGSGSCCNESVSATANMVTSNVALSANYGSAAAPAACVRGTACCDIAGFNTSLTFSNGKYYVHVNGGSVPIQEVEISMIDYHVAYSEADCKPANMGAFGTLSSPTTTLSGLLLNAANQNTNSLNWLPGSPAVLNTSVQLNILDPRQLNLSCCKVTFSFCLKVRVKDVNCNVCEKTICYSSGQEPEPDRCGCGKWKTSVVSINQSLTDAGTTTGTLSPQAKKMIIPPLTAKQVACGNLIELKRNVSYAFTGPDYVCEPGNCAVSYQWRVVAPNNLVTSGNGKNFNFSFATPGVYSVLFIPNCGGKRCDPCVVTVRIPGLKPVGGLESQDLHPTKE